MFMSTVLVGVIAAGASLVATPVVRSVVRRLGWVAKPSAERWHRQPTALFGGIAIFVGFTAGLVYASLVGAAPALGTWAAADRTLIGILAAAAVMFLTGLLDDRFNARPTTKLILQGAAGAVLVGFGVVYPLTAWIPVNVVITLFWFIALTNAVNLLDNMDGVAVGVTGVAALFMSVGFVLEGEWGLAVLCVALLGAIIGFLPYNFNPASIFMGDSGSLFLGALLAGLGAAYPGIASRSIASVLFVPVIIVAIPILDTLLVTTTRTLAGRPVSIGGRDHTTHRLVAMGLSERQAALLLYAFAAAGGLVALFLSRAALPMGIWLAALFLAVLLLSAAYLSRLHSYTPGEHDRPNRRVTVLVSDLLHKRRAFELLLDLLLLATAYGGAYLLRYDGRVPASQLMVLESTLAVVVVSKLIAFGVLGVYKGRWHQLTIVDGHRLVKANLLGSAIALSATVLVFREAEFARSIFILDLILAGVLTLGARLSFRSLDLVRHALKTGAQPALIYGAGRAGELVVRELIANDSLQLRPIGFIDDDASKQGTHVHGYPVMGGVRGIRGVLDRLREPPVIVCSRAPSSEGLEELLQVCTERGLRLLKLELSIEEMTIPTTADRLAAYGHSAVEAAPALENGARGARLAPVASSVALSSPNSRRR